MMKTIATTLSLAVAVAMANAAQADILPAYQSGSDWFTEAQTAIADKTQLERIKAAKNVILFVGDGMGISTLTAARILEGQNNGNTGEENLLSFETFPYSALAKTYNTNQQTPDSAGTMTAMMTGVKTKAGVIGLSPEAVRAECENNPNHQLFTALEAAELVGKATGIVSTARLTHATPAATYAKSPERNWEDDSDMPEEAIAAGCTDIASQLIDFPYGDGIDVAMGGGRRHFLPNDATANSIDAVSTVEGNRTDGRNLVEEWKNAHSDGYYADVQSEFDAIPNTAKKVFALFNESHMHYEADRTNDIGGEPSLTQMTEKAINVLSNDEDGYFLMVESGRIDHGHHAGSAYNALTDAVELSNAVKKAVELTNDEETLIIVTADHSHVFTIAGYPTRGNPILGKVITNDGSGAPLSDEYLAADGMPYTTLGYNNGLGYASLSGETDADARYDTGAYPISSGTRVDLASVNTQDSGFHQEALVPLSSETHAGEDVAVHAMGPSAYLFQGVIEQNVLFQVMKTAMSIDDEI
ncbi:alkaline phosphatase [Neptunomonas phycophila]|uniref:alkaline phosphatase n=1 Tax=Neptunomonas phycophila TaxID=1572645 RepID=UPI0037350563